MDKITVAKIIDEQVEIANLSDTRNQTRDALNKEITRLKWDVYEPKIRAIVQERDEAIQSIVTKQEATIAEIQASIEDHYSIIRQVKRILEFLRLDKDRPLSIYDDEVILNGCVEPYSEGLGYLFNDEFLKVKVFIIANRKPKNKYSLVCIGRSIFNAEIMKFPRSYGLDILSSYKGFNIEISVKDMATPSELKEWYTKHKAVILRDTLSEYQKAKKEYLATIRGYTIEDFKDLIAWTCLKCSNFYTTFDSLAINYTPQCYHHEPYVDMTRVMRPL